jgi:hypothetical protein
MTSQFLQAATVYEVDGVKIKKMEARNRGKPPTQMHKSTHIRQLTNNL